MRNEKGLVLNKFLTLLLIFIFAFSLSGCTQEESTDNSMIVDNFLNSEDGIAFLEVAAHFSDSFYKNDTNAMINYLLEPVSEVKGFGENIYDKILSNTFHMGPADIVGDTIAHASYEFMIEGEDSYRHLHLSMEKEDGQWGVFSYGLSE